MVRNKGHYAGLIILMSVFLTIFLFNLNDDFKNLNHEEFSQVIDSKDVFVINTHTPYMGEIEGTDLIAENWENMELYEEKLPDDKNTLIAVYCRSGRMSESAAEQLYEMGYRNIHNLEGGMISWEQNGREIIQE
ncbi:MAG: rhodanese-like domain-containing protein [Candidatus Pacearchaeota archaeon]